MSNTKHSEKVDEIFARIPRACSMTGCSQSYIKMLIKQNKIISHLPSPKVRLIEIESLIAYIKENNKVNQDED